MLRGRCGAARQSHESVGCMTLGTHSWALECCECSGEFTPRPVRAHAKRLRAHVDSIAHWPLLCWL